MGVDIADYQAALEFLYSLRLFGTKLGLNNIRRLLELLGDPHRGLSFYHIAGTNGKGSVAAILQALLRTTHHRAGLFISPHLEDFRERIRINDRLISRREVVMGVEEIKPLLDRVARRPGCTHPTYFEAVTALACRYFHKKEADAIVLETGLGGRLDATNVVDPLVTVITNIDLEHQKYLGNSIVRITREKGGIIKRGVPLVTAERKPGALSRLKSLCRSRRVRLVEVGKVYRSVVTRQEITGQTLTVTGPRRVYPGLFLPLTGEHQVTNCETAFAAWEEVDPRSGKVAVARVREAVRGVSWPGRFEFITGPMDVILDGAHNRAGARACAKTLQSMVDDRPIMLIIGILDDKDAASICRCLVPLARKVIAVQPESERALPCSVVARICRAQKGSRKIPVSARKSLESAIKYCYRIRFSDRKGNGNPLPLVCITGSLHLVGEARKILKNMKFNL